VSTTSGTNTAGVLRGLTQILEHADALLAEGYSPHVALVAALVEHRPSLALSRVARAAWALAMRTHDASTTTLEGADERGDRA